MNKLRIIAASTTYALILIITFGALCYSSALECRLVDNVSWSEVIMPFVVVLFGLTAIGVIVSFLYIMSIRSCVRFNPPQSKMCNIALGAVCGLIPKAALEIVLWEVYMGWDLVPFLVAGLSISIIIGDLHLEKM